MPLDRGSLDAQLREIGEGERWWEHREFRDLPYLLHADERVRGIAVGKLLGRRRPRIGSAPRWLFVVTDQRLLCLRQERFARKQVDIIWGQIKEFQQGGGMGSYRLRIVTPERRYRVHVPRADAERFATALAPFLPRPAERRLHPDLEPLAWVPGIDRVAALPPVAGLISKFAMLSPPAEAMRRRDEALEATVEQLRSDVDQLQQQVRFLEDLLEKRGTGVLGERTGSAP